MVNKPILVTQQPPSPAVQERRLDRTILRTFRTNLDIDDIVPNPHQPRLGPKEDDELQRQIEANEGLFEPLLVEPHPDLPGKYRIIDGDRRWTNCKILLERGKTQYQFLPAEVTDRTLSEDERLRAWIPVSAKRMLTGLNIWARLFKFATNSLLGFRGVLPHPPS